VATVTITCTGGEGANCEDLEGVFEFYQCCTYADLGACVWDFWIAPTSKVLHIIYDIDEDQWYAGMSNSGSPPLDIYFNAPLNTSYNSLSCQLGEGPPLTNYGVGPISGLSCSGGELSGSFTLDGQAVLGKDDCTPCTATVVMS
jgi:hypothetical protein